MIELLTSRPWKSITNAAAKCKRPAHVAVAYLGIKGDALLPLSEGSSLVVDASIEAVQAGSTNPSALDRLRTRGIDVYSSQYLHAKVFAFDSVAFIGSTNASKNSDERMIEAVVCFDDAQTIASVRTFVTSLCLTKLSASDLSGLSKFYRFPKRPKSIPEQSKYSTLVMELTREQGGTRVTQVQPPKAVWEHFFGLKFGVDKMPSFSLLNETSPSLPEVIRVVVKHDHNYTIELPGTELPRPAILQMRRVGRNKYSYSVHRPGNPKFPSLLKLLDTVPNPLWQPGRRWIII